MNVQHWNRWKWHPKCNSSQHDVPDHKIQLLLSDHSINPLQTLGIKIPRAVLKILPRLPQLSQILLGKVRANNLLRHSALGIKTVPWGNKTL